MANKKSNNLSYKHPKDYKKEGMKMQPSNGMPLHDDQPNDMSDFTQGM